MGRCCPWGCKLTDRHKTAGPFSPRRRAPGVVIVSGYRASAIARDVGYGRLPGGSVEEVSLWIRRMGYSVQKEGQHGPVFCWGQCGAVAPDST